MIKTIASFIDSNIVIENINKLTSVFFKSLLIIVNSSVDIKHIDDFSKATDELLRFIDNENESELEDFICQNQELIKDIFVAVLLGKPKSSLPGKIEEQLEFIAKASKIAEVFFELLFSLRQQAFTDSNEHYWRLLAFIVKHIETDNKKRTVLVNELVEFIKNTNYEKASNDKNESLCGALTVLSNA